MADRRVRPAQQRYKKQLQEAFPLQFIAIILEDATTFIYQAFHLVLV